MTALGGVSEAAAVLLRGAKELLPVWRQPPPGGPCRRKLGCASNPLNRNKNLSDPPPPPLPSLPHYGVYTLVPPAGYNSFSEILHDETSARRHALHLCPM
jgi:hypothetical protein